MVNLERSLLVLLKSRIDHVTAVLVPISKNNHGIRILVNNDGIIYTACRFLGASAIHVEIVEIHEHHARDLCVLWNVCEFIVYYACMFA